MARNARRRRCRSGRFFCCGKAEHEDGEHHRVVGAQQPSSAINRPMVTKSDGTNIRAQYPAVSILLLNRALISSLYWIGARSRSSSSASRRGCSGCTRGRCGNAAARAGAAAHHRRHAVMLADELARIKLIKRWWTGYQPRRRARLLSIADIAQRLARWCAAPRTRELDEMLRMLGID